MADSQIFQVAVATFTQRFDVLESGVSVQYRLATDPARHHSVQLAGYGFINLVTGQSQSAHAESLADARFEVCAPIGRRGCLVHGPFR